jgi:DNA mismatch endonuclease (patch repair protein)
MRAESRKTRMSNVSPSSAAARKRMQSTPQRDTPAELNVRRLLHRQGLRYSLDARPIPESVRRADIHFRRAKVAVFVDGCFWHGCPIHGTMPKANRRFWRTKIEANKERDFDTNRQLRRRGWLVVRIWEHENPEKGAHRVVKALERRQLTTT